MAWAPAVDGVTIRTNHVDNGAEADRAGNAGGLPGRPRVIRARVRVRVRVRLVSSGQHRTHCDAHCDGSGEAMW
jgi:hypothetical protein